MKNKEIVLKCFYCDNFAISTDDREETFKHVCKVHDTRSLDEIEKDIQ